MSATFPLMSEDLQDKTHTVFTDNGPAIFPVTWTTSGYRGNRPSPGQMSATWTRWMSGEDETGAPPQARTVRLVVFFLAVFSGCRARVLPLQLLDLPGCHPDIRPMSPCSTQGLSGAGTREPPWHVHNYRLSDRGTEQGWRNGAGVEERSGDGGMHDRGGLIQGWALHDLADYRQRSDTLVSPSLGNPQPQTQRIRTTTREPDQREDGPSSPVKTCSTADPLILNEEISSPATLSSGVRQGSTIARPGSLGVEGPVKCESSVSRMEEALGDEDQGLR
ncbi:unnamed protein product [Lota lota]